MAEIKIGDRVKYSGLATELHDLVGVVKVLPYPTNVAECVVRFEEVNRDIFTEFRFLEKIDNSSAEVVRKWLKGITK